MRYLGQPDEGTGAQELWGCCVPQSGSLRLSLAREPAPKIGGEQVEAAPEGRPYDLVIWGATGFTGRLMVEHLDALVSSGETKGKLAWALAGRSEKRLRALAAQCKSGPAVLVAQQDLEQVAAQASVFISAAGPYTQCGEAAVRACVLSRTHYVDVAGETVWLHQMIQRFGGCGAQLEGSLHQLPPGGARQGGAAGACLRTGLRHRRPQLLPSRAAPGSAEAIPGVLLPVRRNHRRNLRGWCCRL
ncbi:unnamed protein product [Effrenium voratum]|nr:unnamed protein product [Effrenium voratum]